MITRSSYIRHSRGKTIRVPASRIRDRGAVGKGPKVIPELKEGTLLGYTASNPLKTRRRILKKVVKKVGALTTFRKLNAISTFTKRTSPKKSKTMKRDRNWIKKTYI